MGESMPRPPVSDQDLILLLREVQQIALSPYPFHDGDVASPILCLALGEIAGRASRAIDDYEAADHTDWSLKR
jgi:hypothetical protein